ncbi:BREX-1 system adenine-specific DNA-methyltransferase PglX [Aneurinibacillus sp. Ricciae_BoGa-3]|uniref:BREX-1 system adenine-specific DNA-methyltransferase PglX n=1 Tax=Aneurinibacillus sp. Ricciae_BoGa-3 TaxID=3022697 RepID=UPI0023419A58|nr:BREX-1 system adenine-specific DNA-methyltransferase PglX [Aneurinibacillus sp. Ricciae_BoGa-3]WCK54750.1 BREX-1 system adenine-specific DNA-methyltransferase PglX [Aneurinibacillus sp. Ricciae_BoGa-3]
MNKTELKKFAAYARTELRKLVQLRANTFGITPEGAPTLYEGSDYVEIHNERYALFYRNALRTLVKEYQKKGYDQLIEEVAYMWFNRIIALRYMELHDYLPSHVRVLSSVQSGKVDPDLITEYRTVGFSIDEGEITDLLQQGKREEAYRQLLIAQCNELSEIMPFLFEKLNDYTELLLPDYLLAADSLINQLVQNEELTESFQEVEVIGWLYQFYISEKKDEVFAGLKKNKKIMKENIPAATQLFTPAWIVKYMVENSLGHLWMETYPQSPLKSEMRYYIEPAEQEPEIQAKLDKLCNAHINLEELTIIDPACGSGHILVYAFDLLYAMYEEQGYPTREIPRLILENNLYGLDVDDRAVQLAGFALLMKAREKSRSISRKAIQPNVISVQESNGMDTEVMAKFLYPDDETKACELKELFDTYHDAKNYGSLLQPKAVDFGAVYQRIEEVKEQGAATLFDVEKVEMSDGVKKLVRQTELLSSQYDVVVTNPPYMGSKNGMNKELKNFIQKFYNDYKADLYATFIERSQNFTREFGFTSMINQQSWMFLNSYEKVRKNLLKRDTIYSMLHLGQRAFEEIGGEVVQSTSYVIRKVFLPAYKACYYRLVDYSVAQEKERAFLSNEHVYFINQQGFEDIPNSPIAYWASEQVRKIFKNSSRLSDVAEAKVGLQTGDNNRFLRLWHEIDYGKFGANYENEQQAFASKKKWFPYNKGGTFKKWYGNQEYVVNWENNGADIISDKQERLAKGLIEKKNSSCWNKEYYFREGITWSDVTTGKISVRYKNQGIIFDITGPTIFLDNKYGFKFLLSFMNSAVCDLLLKMVATGLHYNTGVVSNLPIITSLNKHEINLVNKLVDINISTSRCNYDSFETSWDFERHPFLIYRNNVNILAEAFSNWEAHAENQFRQLQQNEEELNRIFIELYSFKNELTPEVPDEEVTIRRAERERDAKTFLSYFIGCAMGRYSIDVDGLAHAGSEWDESKYSTFIPQNYGILSLNDRAYFEDDVILRLHEFLKVTFGEEPVQENLYWLAESLTLKRNETAVERLRRYFLDEFYKDHVQTYQKRPIYWLVDSGKQIGMRALIYLHRYTKETLATLRFVYLQELQIKYTNEIKRLEDAMTNPSLPAIEKKKLDKELTSLRKRQEELVEFDKLLGDYANRQIELDLDNGVAVNYAKFGKLLAALK